MPGMTAYTGLLDIGKPQAGETVVVAAASGRRRLGGRPDREDQGRAAVGIAGGKDKCDYVKKSSASTIASITAIRSGAKLKDACRKGIDVYFENVGGAVFEAVFPLLNAFARVPVCGLIAHYNDTQAVAPKWAATMMRNV
jgi:NADPH-dependent curcumin reductase CurA